MRHVTISMDDELLRKVELAANDAGLSLSDYISSQLGADSDIAALETFLSGPKLNISEGGRMPSADERNAR